MIEEYRRIFDDLTGMPAPPNFIVGLVCIGDSIAGDGMLLQGVIDGKGRGKCNLELKANTITDEPYNFSFAIPDEGLHRSEIGKTVEFYLNDVKCEETFEISNYGDVVVMDLHVPEDAFDEEVDEVNEDTYDPIVWLENLQKQLDKLSSDIPIILKNLNEVNVLPVLVYGKRLPHSKRYLSEWITPHNLYVENAVLKLLYGSLNMDAPEKKTDDEKFAHIFSVICKDINYIYDDRVYGVDYWQEPEETLMRLCGDCEDTSFALLSLVLSAGIPRDRVRMVLGSVTTDWGIFGHAWVEYLVDDSWKLAETTLDDPIDDINELVDVPPTYKRELSFNDRDYVKYDVDGNPVIESEIIFNDLEYNRLPKFQFV